MLDRMKKIFANPNGNPEAVLKTLGRIFFMGGSVVAAIILAEIALTIFAPALLVSNLVLSAVVAGSVLLGGIISRDIYNYFASPGAHAIFPKIFKSPAIGIGYVASLVVKLGSAITQFLCGGKPGTDESFLKKAGRGFSSLLGGQVFGLAVGFGLLTFAPVVITASPVIMVSAFAASVIGGMVLGRGMFNIISSEGFGAFLKKAATIAVASLFVAAAAQSVYFLLGAPALSALVPTVSAAVSNIASSLPAMITVLTAVTVEEVVIAGASLLGLGMAAKVVQSMKNFIFGEKTQTNHTQQDDTQRREEERHGERGQENRQNREYHNLPPVPGQYQPPGHRGIDPDRFRETVSQYRKGNTPGF